MSDIKSINELTVYDEEARKNINILKENKIDDITIVNNNLILKANDVIKKEIDIPSKVVTVNNINPDNNGNVAINSNQIQEYDDYGLDKGNVHNYINHLCSENISSAKDLVIENKQLYLKQINGAKIGAGVTLTNTVESNSLPLDNYLSNGSYNKAIWEKGDTIHKERLNKLENVLYDNVEKTKILPYDEEIILLDNSVPIGSIMDENIETEVYYFDKLVSSVPIDTIDLTTSKMIVTYNNGVKDITINITDFSPDGSGEYIDDINNEIILLTTIPCAGPNEDKLGMAIIRLDSSENLLDCILKKVTWNATVTKNTLPGKYLQTIDCDKIDFTSRIWLNDLIVGNTKALSLMEYYGLFKPIFGKLSQVQVNQAYSGLLNGGTDNYYNYNSANGTHDIYINTKESLGWKGIKIENAKSIFNSGILSFEYLRARIKIIREIIWTEGAPPTVENYDISNYINDTNNKNVEHIAIHVGNCVGAFKVNVYIMFTKADNVSGQGQVTNMRFVESDTMLDRDKIPTKTSQLQNDSNFIIKGSDGLGKVDNILFNQAGELEITIGGITKTFTPKV